MLGDVNLQENYIVSSCVSLTAGLQ